MKGRTTSFKPPELQRVSNHLYHEAEMLISLAKVLASRLTGRQNPVARALLESFLIHLCVVIDFLYPRGPEDHGIQASSFFDSPGQWGEIRDKYIDENSRKVLTEARDRADKELVCLIRRRQTYKRLNVATPRAKWEFIMIDNEVRKAVKVFVEHVPKDRLDPKWELAL